MKAISNVAILCSLLSGNDHIGFHRKWERNQYCKKKKDLSVENSYEYLRDVYGRLVFSCKITIKKKMLKNHVRLGSGGLRTHASEETGALNQRLRPLGHATQVLFFHIL